jgi:hypothetical protein
VEVGGGMGARAAEEGIEIEDGEGAPTHSGFSRGKTWRRKGNEQNAPCRVEQRIG